MVYIIVYHRVLNKATNRAATINRVIDNNRLIDNNQ